jgi:hypothetical protein
MKVEQYKKIKEYILAAARHFLSQSGLEKDPKIEITSITEYNTVSEEPTYYIVGIRSGWHSSIIRVDECVDDYEVIDIQDVSFMSRKR